MGLSGWRSAASRWIGRRSTAGCSASHPSSRRLRGVGDVVIDLHQAVDLLAARPVREAIDTSRGAGCSTSERVRHHLAMGLLRAGWVGYPVLLLAGPWWAAGAALQLGGVR